MYMEDNNELPMSDTERHTEIASAGNLNLDRPDVEEYQDLASELRSRVSGEVKFDRYAQVLYATDGSIYQAQPAGAVLPKSAADVQAVIEVASKHDVPVLPRGAGSSLGGQTVGPGCIVLDFTRHMDDIIELRPEDQRAVVQPGLVQDHLDEALAEYDLKFAPDPASSNRSTIGGGIGNNSTGAHSVRYGITDAYTEELQVVLANGDLIHTREIVLDSDEYNEIIQKDNAESRIYQTVRQLVEENKEEIENRYPNLKRVVTGYNLDRVIYENEEGEDVINLSKLFVGAEGTLGVIVEAEVSLVSVPEETALALYFFDNLVDTMKAVPEALEFDVSAVELMDDDVFRMAAESEGYSEYTDPIPEGAKAALMLEFDSELVHDFEDAIAETNDFFVKNGNAFDVVEAYSQKKQDRIWKLRKAVIPLLMSMEGDPKPYPFIEDATVPPEELAEYVQGFEEVLNDHSTSAAYFAHAGSGTLHIRPILNLKEQEGIEKMRSITQDVTDLVVEHHGSFSGEHGDGMARTEFTPKMYGEDLWDAFKQIKTAFDPDWIMHPGNVVYRDDPEDYGPDSGRGVGADMRKNLRYGADYQSIEPQTELDFTEEGGFSHLVELCNGCGTCRQTESDVMCPTYRVSKEETQTTRGRANMLRAAISGNLPEEELHSERFQEEIMNLCIGCKGCKSDCPTGVDMAKLRAEVKHQHHEKDGAGIRDKLFRDVDRLSKVGSMLAPISNIAQKVPGSREILSKVMGIAKDRKLPTFRRTTLLDWFEQRGGPQISEREAIDKVVLFPDTYTTYSYPEPGIAAIKTLESAGIRVEIMDNLAPSGRAAFSKGFLDTVRTRAEQNVELLDPKVQDGYSVVFVEPSDAVMFQDEYLDILDGEAVGRVSGAAFGVLEYMDQFRVDERLTFDAPDHHLTYHGHCNQKATNKDHHAVGVMRRAGYAVDPLDSSCCGMAGSFGYEKEHYGISKAIGRLVYDKIRQSDGDRVVAPGASCRTQIEDGPVGDKPDHPIEMVAKAVTGSAQSEHISASSPSTTATSDD